MFAGGQHVSITDATDYDFEKTENAAKWKGVFVTSLRKVRMLCSHMNVDILLQAAQAVCRTQQRAARY